MLTVVKEIKLAFLSVKYNIIRQMSNPLSFVLNVLFMMLNNSAFLVEWGIFFTLKDSIGSYGFKEVCLLWGLSAGSFGLAHILFNGAFNISKTIEDGGLDQYLIMPRDVLMSTITSSTSISAIGDLLYGIIVSFIFYHSPSDIVLILLFIILASIVYTSFGIITNSLAFRFVKVHDLVENLRGIFVTFSVYPDEIFDNIVKILVYTIIPIGFSIYVPAKIIMSFDLVNLIIVILFTIFIALLAYFIFNRGLKRYTSSNLAVLR